MFDYGYDASGHETSCPDGLTGPSHLCDFDDPTSARYLYPSTGATSDKFVDADAITSIDHDLHLVALHDLPSAEKHLPLCPISPENLILAGAQKKVTETNPARGSIGSVVKIGQASA